MKYLLISLLSLIFVVSQAQAEVAAPQGDGTIRLYNYHLQEFAEVSFRNASGLIPSGFDQVKKILRSRGNQTQTEMDVRLIDLIDFLQDHFQADTIEIISGYRDPDFNAKLKQEGHKVSGESRHMNGGALDIHIDEIREETLRDYLLSLGLGGVGYYGPLDFVHVDFGPVKQWNEPHGARKVIGVMNARAPVQLTSDKNDYLPEESLLFTWSFAGEKSMSDVRALRLQLFRRGQWTDCEAATAPAPGTGLPASTLLCRAADKKPTYGKYRWIFQINGSPDLQSSNEFYLKRL